MAFTAEQLQTKRDALISQIAQATTQLTAGDKSITFQSIEAMQRALQVLDAEISQVTGTTPSRVMRFYTRQM